MWRSENEEMIYLYHNLKNKRNDKNHFDLSNWHRHQGYNHEYFTQLGNVIHVGNARNELPFAVLRII